MANQWFKFYGMEYLSDPKMLELSSGERSCWLTLLCYASIHNGIVFHITEEKLMIQAGIDFQDEEWERTKGVLEHFKKLDMITADDNAMITVKHWTARQEIILTGYERVKRYRQKNKQMKLIDNDDNADDNIRIEKNRIEKNRKEINTLFEIFWKEYPNKVSKQKCLAKWQKINPNSELQAKIMVALQNHKESEQWQKDEGKFIPHPTTWLHQSRWEQVLPKAKAPVKKPYYKGDPMVQKNGKWYVIVKGQWLEYAGKQKEIEYK